MTFHFSSLEFHALIFTTTLRKTTGKRQRLHVQTIVINTVTNLGFVFGVRHFTSTCKEARIHIFRPEKRRVNMKYFPKSPHPRREREGLYILISTSYKEKQRRLTCRTVPKLHFLRGNETKTGDSELRNAVRFSVVSPRILDFEDPCNKQITVLCISLTRKKKIIFGFFTCTRKKHDTKN